MNRNGRRGGNRVKRERIRANCNGQGTLVNLGGGRRGRGGQNHHWTGENSKLNLEIQSLEIYQAAVWVLEQHQPIMNKLGGL